MPDVYPVCIDWDEEIYMGHENNFRFSIGGSISTVANTDICMVTPYEQKRLLFSIKTEFKTATFELVLFKKNSTDTPYDDFKIEQITKEKIEVSYGSKTVNAIDFSQNIFQQYGLLMALH